ncbi:hypothetical protein FA95DRAFT_1504529, partial [Auriscalpium vulgare]
VDDLLVFWTPGVWFSRTARCDRGRLFLAALVPLVCDLPAAKQIAGFTNYNSKNFCSYCLLTISDIDDNIDIEAWTFRTYEQHIADAKAWRDAKTPAKRKEKENEHGVRWSELLRLPYWNPVVHTVAESMHALYLGLLRNHCFVIWGMEIGLDDNDVGAGHVGKQIQRPSDEQLAKARAVLDQGGDLEALKNCKKPALWHLCEEYGLRMSGTIKGLATTLIRWVSHSPPPKANGRHDTSLSPSDDSSTLQSTRTRQSEVEKEHLINDADQKLSTAATVDKAVLTGYTRAILKELCKRRQLPSYKVENKLFGKAPETKKTDPKAGVLGRKVLGEVRKDMEKTQLPAWVSPVPSNVGSKGHGKLSADHWLTFTTVHLVITLIRLWGAEEGRYKQILDNFIDLVAAVQVAGLRFLTMDNIEFYELIMTRYLKTMKALYRHAKVKAIHHLALHLSDFLRLFGPVHAWRAFAFERYNYILQQENTNGKFGELELTFMKHTSRSANLRPLLDDPHIKKKLSKLVDEYDALRQEDRRGTRIQDTINIHSSDGVPRLDRCQDEQCLSDAQYEALAKKLSEDCPGMYVRDGAKTQAGQISLTRTVTTASRIFLAGVTYKIHEVAPKDSNVIFRLSDTTTTAGRITSLFTHERMEPGGRFRKETFLAVEALSDLQEDQVSQDPYRQFHADFGLGRLYQNDYQPHCYVVKPSQIVCHFAKTVLNDLSMPGDFVHALPLNRVSTLFQPNDWKV